MCRFIFRCGRLNAGRTTIRYQGLEVVWSAILPLSKDLSNIRCVDADIYPEAKKLLSKGTRFWLVKPGPQACLEYLKLDALNIR
ncbi:hypothetical protein OH492_25535 [Vibrio chagasii]|nr:hypothetical protein [Vibrio chagasii]